MFALRFCLFGFVCLAQSRGNYYYGQSRKGVCYGKPNGNYEDPDNCYGFITCSNWRTFKRKCNYGLKYNKKMDRCDWNVQCGQEAECKKKTTSGDCCSLPFNYYGVKYYSCTKANHNKLWCSLDPVYRGRWGNCEAECKKKTTTGQCCSLPFNYNGVKYYSCTKANHNKLWCSLDPVYRKRWGNCEETSCQEGSTSYDECGQRCTCVGGQLANCVRIRKEFTSLTLEERKRHIDTILKVTAEDSQYRPEYVELINEHHELFDTLIHQKEHFIPWHRYYILRYENLMRKADCRFTATYWDWSLDTENAFKTVQNNVWDSKTGFGGGGSGTDNCVLDGPFRKGVWKRVRPDGATGTDCLARDFRGSPPDEIDVMELLNIDDFEQFEFTLRGPLHDNVHCQIGATMCTIEAASAPEFFLHHAFIDKIWDDWQKKSWANKNAYFPTVNSNMPKTQLRPAKLIYLSDQPGDVSVEYEPFKKEEVIRKKHAGLSTSQLRVIPRHPFTGISLRAIALFKISVSEVKKIRKTERWLDPKVILPKY